MPARKKDPSTRRRRNKSASQATLERPNLSTVEDFSDMTVAQLRDAIDAANVDRPADQKIRRSGSKAELIERLVAAHSTVPEIPEHPPVQTSEGAVIPVDWHQQTISWWHEVWTSPMAAGWDESDFYNVVVVALLYDDIWTATTAKARKDAMAEYRLQRVDLGLSPYARRRLEWTIATADEATDKRKRRQNQPQGGSDGQPGKSGEPGPPPEDPRKLFAVK